MHIALGVNNEGFPIKQFLGATRLPNITITAAAAGRTRGNQSLSFSSNPTRRGGEWLIRDQYTNRHMAWTPGAGFPTRYDRTNPPYVLIVRVDNAYHARFTTASRLSRLPAVARPDGILTETKGIGLAPLELLDAFSVPHTTLLDSLRHAESEDVVAPFDPASIVDGRNRILASILLRQGQQLFRRRLLAAYATRCAVTRCTTQWVLEAAHITPYRGPKTNALSNGLLLRADIHTLFDVALIAIEPSRLRIRVSSRLDGSPYTVYDGKRPALPRQSAAQPSMAALEEHYSLFQA
jgi:hypothetical protein